jgi:hypothetical protein
LSPERGESSSSTKEVSITVTKTDNTAVGIRHKVLRRIFGLKRDEVTAEWRKLHNEDLHDLYFSPSIIRIIKVMRMR